MDSFYTDEELKKIGFKNLGNNVKISRKCSIYGAENIALGSNVRIDDFSVLSGKIIIGNYVHIAFSAALFGGKSGIEIGDYCGVSGRSYIYAETDDYTGIAMTNPTIPDEYRCVISKKVVMEKHALIGAGSIVLPGVHIGEGASFGSMSLVLKDAKPWMLYVGIPAKAIKERKCTPLELEKRFF